jgi:hypothetical protein
LLLAAEQCQAGGFGHQLMSLQALEQIPAEDEFNKTNHEYIELQYVVLC